VEEKRGFRPHLTIARVRSARNLKNVQEILRSNAASDFGEYRVEGVRLKKSILGPQGPSYSTVFEHRL
jgi:2'-5' RNA ligase